MPRTFKPRWHAGNQQWVSDCGEPFVDGKGRRRRRTVAFPGIGRKEEKRARDALRAYLDREEERRQNGDDPIAATIVEHYLEWVEANRERATYDMQAIVLSKFVLSRSASGPVESVKVSRMDPQLLERVIADMAAAGNKPSYLAAMYAVVQACFNWAALSGAQRNLSRRCTTVTLAATCFRLSAQSTAESPPPAMTTRLPRNSSRLLTR